jgi:hypothetical protein
VGVFRFLIEGTVREAGTGRLLGRLLVKAWDKDVLKDDHLGDAITDEDGHFEIRFTDLAFRDVVEQRPDVYLKVYAPDGTTELCTTEANVRRNARAQEHYEILVPAERLAATGG